MAAADLEAGISPAANPLIARLRADLTRAPIDDPSGCRSEAYGFQLIACRFAAAPQAGGEKSLARGEAARRVRLRARVPIV